VDMKPILEVQNVGKKYRIQHQTGGYLSLRERMLNIFKSGSVEEDFWALKNVTFEVFHGESLGIIGRNGAGKSTLLKVLSKITPPTKGRIISRGRIASLLEVGTGFHPELTGRENIFFNGSLLGMKSKEIEAKFDEIVDFSGVEKFLDTLLKHYSNGMQLRLAFAVAAFLEPEILIIDEVLAVGDAEFQRKCLGKMEDVSKSGRTILFVSHNMAAVQNLCKRAVFLDKGVVKEMGTSHDIILSYYQSSKSTTSINANIDRPTHVSDLTIYGKENNIYTFKQVTFLVSIDSSVKRENVLIGFGVNDMLGTRLFTLFSKHVNKNYNVNIGVNKFTAHVEALPLKPGIYSVEIYVGDGVTMFDYYNQGYTFEVIAPQDLPYNLLPDESQGSFIINQEWN